MQATTMFMGKPANIGEWKEWQLQAYVVQEARRAGYCVAGDMNQGRRSGKQAALAKATGMLAGETDLRFYLPGAKICLIELKKADGRMSEAQKQHHSHLMDLGFWPYVVYAHTPAGAWEKVHEILKDEAVVGRG